MESHKRCSFLVSFLIVFCFYIKTARCASPDLEDGYTFLWSDVLSGTPEERALCNSARKDVIASYGGREVADMYDADPLEKKVDYRCVLHFYTPEKTLAGIVWTVQIEGWVRIFPFALQKEHNDALVQGMISQALVRFPSSSMVLIVANQKLESMKYIQGLGFYKVPTHFRNRVHKPIFGTTTEFKRYREAKVEIFTGSNK